MPRALAALGLTPRTLLLAAIGLLLVVASERTTPPEPVAAEPAALLFAGPAAASSRDEGERLDPGESETVAPWQPLAPDRLPESVRGRPIPSTFFGLHLLSIGMHGQWPDVPFGIYRTWDGVYRWHTMRPRPGQWYPWSLEQLDGLRDIVAGRAEVMFTLAGGGPNGGFPPWLNPRARDRTAIHAEWRTYVRTLGERLKGTVRYWEIWNEIDCTCFFDAPVDLLVELTDIAAAELRAIDPANSILSAVNSVPGSKLFDDYLRLGGARNVDIIAWHIDTDHVPERDTAKLDTMRELMQRHGVDHKPLWTTEGHARSFPAATPAADAGILARQHLVLWSQGSQNFSWYGWDVWDYGEYQGNTHWIRLTERQRPGTKTSAGVAYGTLARWLIGASMQALAIDGALWQIDIARPNGYRGRIIWHAEGAPHRVALPDGVTRAHHLDGRVARVHGGASYTTTSSPVLFDR